MSCIRSIRRKITRNMISYRITAMCFMPSSSFIIRNMPFSVSQTIPGKSPYLAFSFYNYVLKTVESYTTKEGIKQKLKLKYSPKKTAGFLCYGLVGFINESHAETDSVSEIMEEASGLLTDLLTSDVLLER